MTEDVDHENAQEVYKKIEEEEKKVIEKYENEKNDVEKKKSERLAEKQKQKEKQALRNYAKEINVNVDTNRQELMEWVGKDDPYINMEIEDY